MILRDHFVCGLAHESTRKQLLTEDNNLTFEKAVQIANSVEKATVQARQMKTETKHFPVHHVQGRDKLSSAVHHHHSKKSTPPVCHRCGGPHLAPACRFTKAKCHSCGKIGHIAPVCRSKPARNSASSTPRNSSFKNTHTVS